MKENYVAEIAVFNGQRLRESNDMILLRVKDLCDSLDLVTYPVRNKGWRQWAQNCDEYVCIGAIPDDCVVQRRTWSDIKAVDFLSYDFTWSYTLGVLRRLSHRKKEPDEIVCQKMMRLARLMGDPEGKWWRTIFYPILRSDFDGWGLSCLGGVDAVEGFFNDSDKYPELDSSLKKLHLNME